MIADALQLANEATNGWACYAKRDIEHREIARLHQAIDALAVRDDGRMASLRKFLCHLERCSAVPDAYPWNLSIIGVEKCDCGLADALAVSPALATVREEPQEPPSGVDVYLLAWAVSNCHTLARRRLRAGSSDAEWWSHVLRICEKAGAQSTGVLRAAVPTEITDGSEARAPHEPPAMLPGHRELLRSLVMSARERDEIGPMVTKALLTKIRHLSEAQEARAAPPLDWRPIATAPKDEKRILLFCPDEFIGGWAAQTGAFYEQLGGWQYDGQGVAYSVAHQPSHWMPLPDPPK